MEFRPKQCYLCKKNYSGKGFKVTNEQYITFIKKRFKEFRQACLICEICYKTVKQAFRIKLNNAIEMKKKSEYGVSSVTEDSEATNASKQSTEINTEVLGISNVSASSDDRPMTSAAAAARILKKQMRPIEEEANDNLSLNAVNGTRRPDYQPIPRRREVQHRDPRVMDMYLADITGG
ncbi:uncharacterized protein LOC119681598 [Teleopsis dalmanni]|uniref:uncharacterized protein LOC119681598 n=1 Tax=Teleopsis dalmanni TaxID=139649 RepID=UPI0018CE9FF0|nr:uncharacterized protein LOC119681598 [Teleopsis dalmanni]